MTTLSILSTLLANPVARSFVFVIAIIFLFAVLRLQEKITWGKTKDIRAQTPTLLTSLGILGTFVGIFVGLWDFNVRDIKESVPPLLEGLKVAFLTSIAGLGAATLLKILMALGIFPERSAEEEEGKEMEVFLKTVEKAIRDALGENFQRLQVSIDRLIEWQNQYKIQLDLLIGEFRKLLIEEFQKALKGIEKTDQAIQAIEESARSIPKHMKKMEDVYGTQEALLQSIADLKGVAENAVPKLESEVQELMDSLKSSLEATQKTLQENIGKISNETEGFIQEAAQRLGAATRGFTEAYERMIKDMERQHEEQIRRIKRIERRLSDDEQQNAGRAEP